VNIHVLACDYDGTVAEHGRIADATKAALARVRESGRKILLVTGRRLSDLRAVCPDVDDLFDAVVAENGALLYFPGRRETKTLGAAPEPALVDALRRRDVPCDIGDSIVASHGAYAEAALDAIRETGVERSLIFNKGDVMLLPGGVTKATGLTAALTAMELSAHNMAGVGDAENDHAFLGICECAVAVADAVPALRERADYVTRTPGSRGVVEFIEEHLLDDLAALLPRLERHRIPLGEDATGRPVAVSAHGTRLLVIGPSASGKSTLTGVLVERLIESGRCVLLLDPEGDYETLAELETVVVLGGKGEQALPAPDEVDQLLRQPQTSLVLDLSAMTLAEKVSYATKILAAVAAVRSTSGMPHWLVIDEAHHILPAEGSPAAELLRPGEAAVCFITLSADALTAQVREMPNAVASTDLEAFEAGVRTHAASNPTSPGSPLVDGGPLERGEAALAWLGPGRRAVRFRVARRRIQHRRHVRKYVEGELPPDRSFFFRGPDRALNLRAANLARFVELAEGVDERTWAHHLDSGDYSAWLREKIKDPDLAQEVRTLEAAGLDPGESRRRVVGIIRQRYAV
jgi:hydroxymethylpyrimidine pyrophosphatase-like HAD family hydrolase